MASNTGQSCPPTLNLRSFPSAASSKQLAGSTCCKNSIYLQRRAALVDSLLKASARPCFSGLPESLLVSVELAHFGGREPTWGQGRQLFVKGERDQQLVREPHSIRLHRMAAPEEKIRDLGLLRVPSTRHAVSVNPAARTSGGRPRCKTPAHIIVRDAPTRHRPQRRRSKRSVRRHRRRHHSERPTGYYRDRSTPHEYRSFGP